MCFFVHIVLLFCLANHSGLSNGCGGEMKFGEILELPKENGNYKKNLHCVFQSEPVGTGISDISPNVLQLSWFSFDVCGEMPACITDYVEIFVR